VANLNGPWEKVYQQRCWTFPELAEGELKKWYIEHTYKGEINTWKIDPKRKPAKLPTSLRVVMVGLDMSGKTTLLYKLKMGEIVTTIPTIGFNVETIKYQKCEATIWDVGGQDKIRPLWRHYFGNTEVVLYVIDGDDNERWEEARDELEIISKDSEITTLKPLLLVLLNKSELPDKPDKILPQAWADKLNLGKYDKSFSKIYVQSVSAFNQNPDELNVIMDWMIHNWEKKKKITRDQPLTLNHPKKIFIISHPFLPEDISSNLQF